MATMSGFSVTIGVRRKPLLYVAAILYGLDGGQGGRLHKAGNWLVDKCVTVSDPVATP